LWRIEGCEEKELSRWVGKSSSKWQTAFAWKGHATDPGGMIETLNKKIAEGDMPLSRFEMTTMGKFQWHE
jgi:hypothetical protein